MKQWYAPYVLLCSYEISEIKCSPYIALASVLTVLFPISEGRHWLPYKITLPTSRNHGAVMPGRYGTPGGLGWHPIGKNYPSEPMHASEKPSSAWGTTIMSQSLLTLLHLTVRCTEQNATINICSANDHSLQIGNITHTKQYIWVVFTIIKLLVKICTFFVQYIFKVLPKLWVASVVDGMLKGRKYHVSGNTYVKSYNRKKHKSIF